MGKYTIVFNEKDYEPLPVLPFKDFLYSLRDIGVNANDFPVELTEEKAAAIAELIIKYNLGKSISIVNIDKSTPRR